MTKELRAKVENELRKAYVHFDVDDEVLEEKIEESMIAIRAIMAGTTGRVIATENEQITGYVFGVAMAEPTNIEQVVRDGKTCNKTAMNTIEMVVNEENIVYVMHSYDVYAVLDDADCNNAKTENEIYKTIALDEIGDEFVAI